MINFLNLQYFLVAAEELHITRAAEKLHISQQALSNHIANLEREFNTKLFTRTPEFSLTDAGKCLVAAGRQIMDIRHQLGTEIAEISSNIRGSLSIGITHTHGLALLPNVLPIFHEKHPLIEINLVEENPQALLEGLIRGTLDLCIDYSPFIHESIEIIELSKERMMLIVPLKFLEAIYGNNTEKMCKKLKNGANLSDFAKLPVIMLKRGDRVRTIFESELYKEGIIPRIIIETGNIQTAFALAVDGMGITVYPESFLHNQYTRLDIAIQDRIAAFPLSRLSSESIVVAYNRFRYSSSAAKDFIDMLKLVTKASSS